MQAVCRKAPTVGAEGRARAKRTRNMDSMSVTLEVSRLSDWLNADAYCQARGEAQEGLRADWKAGGCGAGGGSACSVQVGPDGGG